MQQVRLLPLSSEPFVAPTDRDMLASERRAFVRTHRTCVFGHRRRTDGPALSVVYYIPADSAAAARVAAIDALSHLHGVAAVDADTVNGSVHLHVTVTAAADRAAVHAVLDQYSLTYRVTAS